MQVLIKCNIEEYGLSINSCHVEGSTLYDTNREKKLFHTVFNYLYG